MPESKDGRPDQGEPELLHCMYIKGWGAKLWSVLPSLLAISFLPGVDITRQQRSETRLDSSNYQAWRDLIRTSDQELAWQQLPWLASFHQGLVEAAREQKPLLLWVMNGHPMGCT